MDRLIKISDYSEGKKEVYTMSVIRNDLIEAKKAADTAYTDWYSEQLSEGEEWAELGYGDIVKGIPSVLNIIRLVKDNWGKIAVVGAGFGIPVGVADPGAFKAVLGVVSNLWPF